LCAANTKRQHFAYAGRCKLDASRPAHGFFAYHYDAGFSVIERPPGRRQFGRRPTFKTATIVQGDGARIPATVIDLSEGGARLKISESGGIDEEFYLEIPADDFIVKCRLAHVQETSIGVLFIRPPRRLSWLKK
jgi:hypothetical protein